MQVRDQNILTPVTNLKKPIFIIGCPRSGTSILLQLLAGHSQLGYVNSFVNRRPTRPELSALNLAYDLPLLGSFFYSKQLNSRWLPGPREPWIAFNYYLENFQLERGGEDPPRGRNKSDLNKEEVQRFRGFVRKVLAYQRKHRLISKYTDFPRMKYISTIFPDAIFFHLVRDGRAVANSYLDQIEYGGFDTWEEREWWLTGWPGDWSEKWEMEYGTKITFCGYMWRYFTELIEKEAKTIPENRYVKVKYEDITGAPDDELTKLLNSVGLNPSDASFFGFLDRVELESKNYKWREELSKDQINTLEEVLKQDLVELGYE